MAAKHTPGPWHASEDAIYSGQRFQHIVASTDVGTTNWGARKANARLMALAPELYEYVASSASAGCATAQALISSLEPTGANPKAGLQPK